MRLSSFILETVSYFINYIIAVFIFCLMSFLKIKPKRDIWVFGGNGGEYYSDNSSVLHNYVLSNYPDIDVYWIINKNSVDREIVNGNVLFKHSVKANVIVLFANVLICSHSIRGDIMRSNRKLYKSAVTVDLFHGITAFKDKEHYPKNSLVIATSEEEKAIKLKWKNNTDNSVVITGFPRYDILYESKKKDINKKQIFYMPTSRPWFKRPYIGPSLKDKRDFETSSFFKEIKAFLTDEKLKSILEESGYTMNIFIHRSMHPYIKAFDLDESKIKVLSKDVNVQEQLINSDFLITDYSSVAWDSLFLGREVIFYQFDLSTYVNSVKSCIKIPEELFGYYVDNHKDLIELLDKKIIHGLKKNEYIERKQEEMKARFIQFNDNLNCQRVTTEILKKIEK